MQGSFWRLGDGKRIKFWSDYWCRKNFLLKDVVLEPIEETEANKLVCHYVLPNGNWDVEKIQKYLPKEICNWIVRSFPGIRENCEDDIHWSHHKEGVFYVKAAYSLISKEKRTATERQWKFIWKWPGSQRNRTFMWLCAYDKILTNKQRVKQNFTNDPICDCCRSVEESVIHALRDCLVVKDLWKMLVKPIYWPGFFRGETLAWFAFNSCREMGKFENLNWKVTFGETIRRIWLRRNALIFKAINCDIANLFWSIVAATKDFEESRGILKFSGLAFREIQISWSPPDTG